jgi:hypothetical protein
MTRKDTGTAVALVGYAVAATTGIALGAFCGQYEIADGPAEVGTCLALGKGVVNTDGGGLIKGGT